jgi:uncharacterized protein with ParB-like and HNH nuclease domain
VELSEDLQRSILEYVFSVYILSSNVDDRDVLQIFRRMNSTSYNLNKQELRNATFFGEFKTSAYQLAAEQLNRWRSWRIFTIDDISRMNEVELTSEFMMLIINGEIKRYTQQAITDTYEKYDEVFSSRLEVEERYRNVMETVDDKFGREILPTARNRKSLLYALFAYVYDAIYTLGSKVDRKAHPKTIPLEHIARVKRSIEKIQERSAPEKVVIAVKKSTTDTSSRQALFEYLRG